MIDRATAEGATRSAQRIDSRQWRHQQAVVSREIRRLARAKNNRRPVSADDGLLADATLLPAVIADLKLARPSTAETTGLTRRPQAPVPGSGVATSANQRR